MDPSLIPVLVEILKQCHRPVSVSVPRRRGSIVSGPEVSGLAEAAAARNQVPESDVIDFVGNLFRVLNHLPLN